MVMVTQDKPELTAREPSAEPDDSAVAIEEGDPEFDSVVSAPVRCKRWGDGGYRGNCDGRLFLSLLLRYQPRTVADPMMGSGTTRDVVADLNRNTQQPIEYWGGDLRTEFDLETQPIPGRYDLVWVHPPYWNIVEYGNGASDLSSARSYPEFLTRLTHCLKQCASAVNPGGRLAVLVADVRRRGKYFPLGRDVCNLDGTIGQLRSVVIKVQHNRRSDRTNYGKLEDPRIRHEYCAIFKAPLVG